MGRQFLTIDSLGGTQRTAMASELVEEMATPRPTTQLDVFSWLANTAALLY